MNKELLALRKKFAGQKAKAENVGFDNTPLPEGKYTARVSKSDIVGTKWVRQLKIEVGDHAGRVLFPFAPNLDNSEQIVRAYMDMRRILGDRVPGKQRPDGSVEFDYGDYLMQAEDLAAACVNELVEVTLKNQRPKPDGSHLRQDGTPWQNVFINRGLGADESGVRAQTPRSAPVERAPDNLAITPKRKKKV
jgi:hypothetical protein